MPTLSKPEWLVDLPVWIAEEITLAYIYHGQKIATSEQQVIVFLAERLDKMEKLRRVVAELAKELT